MSGLWTRRGIRGRVPDAKINPVNNMTTPYNNTAPTTGQTTVDGTNTTSTGAGSRIGNKIKGATKVVHGLGESVRGNAMGAIDTATSSGVGQTKNDLVAQRGRAEVEQGMASISGENYSTTSGAAGTTGPRAAGGTYGTGGVAGTTYGRGTGGGAPSGRQGAFHHRDDAIASGPGNNNNLPPPQHPQSQAGVTNEAHFPGHTAHHGLGLGSRGVGTGGGGVGPGTSDTASSGLQSQAGRRGFHNDRF